MHMESELPTFAEELRRRGFDAKEDAVYGPNGVQVGLRLDEHFYPLWELSDPENAIDLAGLRFDSIRLRRTPGWTTAMPDRRQRMARAEYQASYADALNDLRRSATVGEPHMTHDGVRAVHVNGFPMTDELVFKNARGEQAAGDIMRKIDAKLAPKGE